MITIRDCGQRLRPYRGLAALLFLAPAAAAQQSTPAPPDSARALPAVRVEGTRFERFTVGSRLTVIDSVALDQNRAGTLTEVLAARTPLYLRNYGPGQLASITIRGTSAQQTAVLWNGFNIQLPTLGQADFALLPASGNTSVTVQHGPASAVYGTGAVGGTVLLSSPVVWGRGAHISAQGDAGSYGLGAGSLTGSFSNQKIALRTAVSYRAARNDFPYTTREIAGLVERRQENAAFRQWSLAQDATFRVGQKGELMAAVWLTDADRRIQPAIGAANNQAREWDKSRRLLAGYRHVGPRHESAVRVAWFEDILNYESPGTISHSRVHTTQAQLEHTFTFNTKTSLRLGAETQHFSAQVDGYQALKTENRLAGFGLLRYDPLPTLHLLANVRQAVLENQQPPLTPTLGAEWELLHVGRQVLSLKTSASRSYRAPTLNERFWPTGNPDLLPEDGLGYEAGLRHEWESPAAPLSLLTELTTYQQRVDNWVQWLPDAAKGGYTPLNRRLVRVRGLEASSRLTWHPGTYRLVARLAYAFTQSVKTKSYVNDEDPIDRQLPYVPLHTAALTTDNFWRGWQLTTSLVFTGYRYTDVSAVSYLPSYLLLNATVGHTLSVHQNWTLTGLVQAYNLTNRDYRSYAAQAMPPRNGSLSLRVTWR